MASTQQLTYELQVSNNSLTTQADGVQLSVPIPAGATFVSVSDAECSYASQTVTCSFGTLPMRERSQWGDQNRRYRDDRHSGRRQHVEQHGRCHLDELLVKPPAA